METFFNEDINRASGQDLESGNKATGNVDEGVLNKFEDFNLVRTWFKAIDWPFTKEEIVKHASDFKTGLLGIRIDFAGLLEDFDAIHECVRWPNKAIELVEELEHVYKNIVPPEEFAKHIDRVIIIDRVEADGESGMDDEDCVVATMNGIVETNAYRGGWSGWDDPTLIQLYVDGKKWDIVHASVDMDDYDYFDSGEVDYNEFDAVFEARRKQ